MVYYQRDLVSSQKKRVFFNLDLADEIFNISDATSLGIIASECISNSMEHAFLKQENPEIQIKLKNDVDQYIFTYSDNGKGISKENADKLNESLGLRLVDIFSRQLKGTLNILEKKRGFALEVNFQKKYNE